jgi:hypothetical protein
MFGLLTSKQTRFLYLIFTPKLFILMNFTAAVDSVLFLTEWGTIEHNTEFLLSLVPTNINFTFSFGYFYLEPPPKKHLNYIKQN